MSVTSMAVWNARCVTATTTELRTRGLDAILADGRNLREVLITEPGRGWMASVLPGDRPGDDPDVLLFATDPAEQWTDEYMQWAESLEALLADRNVAA